MKHMACNRMRITIKGVAKDAGISRATVYYHYKSLDHAKTLGERWLVDEFKDMLADNFKEKEATNRQVFVTIFILISRHSQLFKHICAEGGNQGLLYKMMAVAYSDLQITWYPISAKPPDLASERVSMYFKIVVEIICKWGQKTDCNLREIEPYLKRILRVTSDASRYCL